MSPSSSLALAPLRVFGRPPLAARNVGLVAVVLSSAVVVVTALAVARLSLQASSRGVIESPRAAVLAKLEESEREELPYPPDCFPGARDVTSPYGTIRVYEWGPPDGRKVLLLHGITTPCIALGGVAHGLVHKGCRVILMDLFGRGYSDSPNLPHDSRLYSTQVLLAVTSSPLPWTPGGFGVVGYSLGGGIAVDFAAAFPGMVSALVLLAPAGLIRSGHFGWWSRLMYSPWVPEGVLEGIVRRRLRGASVQQSSSSSSSSSGSSTPSTGGGVEKVVVSAEIKGNRDPGFESAPLSRGDRPGVTVASAVQWQVENHEGFVRSFVSSIRHASIEGRHETWSKLARRSDKILIIAGATDSIIVPEELGEDAIGAIGAERIEWRVIEAGHEFPITKSEEVVGEISAAWGL